MIDAMTLLQQVQETSESRMYTNIMLTVISLFLAYIIAKIQKVDRIELNVAVIKAQFDGLSEKVANIHSWKNRLMENALIARLSTEDS